MTELNQNRAAGGFTPLRFGLLLGLLIFAAFPQVLLGLETFVVRDYGFFVYPLAHFQQECFRHGELPFWNPYNNCGVPFLAQWNTMPLYPPALLYLALPLGWSLSFFSLGHLWFAGMGMYFLARRWTGQSFAGAFAGTVFAFNGFALNLIMWPSHMATFSWMPWVVLAAEAAWRAGGRKIILAALAGALQMLAGGPEIIFLTWLIVSALWLQQFIQGGSLRPAMLWRFPTVVALVIALSAAQLLPFLDLVAHAQRATGFADLRWSMPGWGWVNFLVPMAFGTTGTEGLFFQYGQSWTSSYYLGLGTLWLALLAIWAGRNSVAAKSKIWLLTIIAVMGLVLSFITYPVKYIAVAIFAAPLLAAFALANLAGVQRRLMAVGAVLLTLLVAILLWTQFAPMPWDDRHATLGNGFSRAFFLILTGAILLALTRELNSKFLRAMPLFLILVAWTDVFTHEPAQNPTAPPWIYQAGLSRSKLALNPQPALGGSRAMVSPMAAYRFITFAAGKPKDNFLAKRLGYCANCNLLDAVPKVDGFLSLTPKENDEVQSLFYTTTNASYPRLEDFMGVSQITAADQIFHWQARVNFLPLVTTGQRPVFMDDSNALPMLERPDFDGRRVVYLPPTAAALVTVTNQTVARVTDCQFGTRTVDAAVDAANPSLVVVAQTYYHDWRAEIDGQPAPLLRANIAFQAVQVPAGRHHLHLFYRDRAFEAGAMISGVAWLGSLPVLLRRRREA